MPRVLLAALGALLLCTALAAQAPDTAGAGATAVGAVAVPPPTEAALRYHRSGNLLWIFGNLWSILVLSTILLTGFSARMRDGAARLARGNGFLTIVAYVAIFSLVVWLVDLPLSYYTQFVRQHAYGLSNQTFGKWLGDSVKGLAVGVVALGLVLWIPYLLLRRSPRRWWLYTALAAVPLVVVQLLVTPVWIDPLFNDFGPMRDRALEARILALADRAGIEGSRVYEVNKSVDTEAVNAYVTGFGRTKRIVLWDTILEKLDDRELLFVMGHEMGHYVLHHTRWLVGLISLSVLVGLYAVHRTAGWVIGRYRHRLGFSALSDVASFPLLILVFSLVSLAITPALYAVTRHFEHESDRFGLEITRDNRAAGTAFVKLQEENLGVPYPGLLYLLWRQSHPPLGERIEFTNSYRPWEAGAPLRYGDRFRGGS